MTGIDVAGDVGSTGLVVMAILSFASAVAVHMMRSWSKVYGVGR